jgi:hypothetical protein
VSVRHEEIKTSGDLPVCLDRLFGPSMQVPLYNKFGAASEDVFGALKGTDSIVSQTRASDLSISHVRGIPTTLTDPETDA